MSKTIKVSDAGWYISTNEKGRYDFPRRLPMLGISFFKYHKVLSASTRDKLIQKINTMYPKYKWQ